LVVNGWRQFLTGRVEKQGSIQDGYYCNHHGIIDLRKGDRPSPLNLNTAHQQTHFIIRKCVSSSTLAFPDKEMIFIMNTVRCSSANAFHHQEMRFIINTGVS
jgi:hypothetical protein